MSRTVAVDGINAQANQGLENQDTVDFRAVKERYEHEKQRRLRADAQSQYEEIETSASSRLASLADDPFVDHEALNAQPMRLVDGQEVKVIILGAGWSGTLSAVHLIEAGAATPEDIRMVDTAGGFGGIWYWNRYPGVMCDTEASIYCPLLEETRHMPTHKYAYGHEIREHAERTVRHWKLGDSAVFRTRILDASWDDDRGRWAVKMETDRGPGCASSAFIAYSQFFYLCGGSLTHPKVPKINGLDDFAGNMFHTARWNYDITGGTPKDAHPKLTGLEGKRVGIVGTGVTAVQAVVELAKWAEELYVFQRTPSSIGTRGQEPTDPDKWKTEIAYKPGWQEERRMNWELLACGESAQNEEKYLPTDGWTGLKTFAVIIGRSDVPEIDPSKFDLKAHQERYLAMDAPLQEAIRHRVDTIVEDRQTAETLKPWYSTWCKRPGFHDEYLQTFNRPNVHLIDVSETQGISHATSRGLIVANGQEIELDTIVLSTGFRPLLNIADPDPGAKSNITVTGRNGITMRNKWAARGASTLHGITTAWFPNLFINDIPQASTSANVPSSLETSARHAAYIVAQTLRRAVNPDRAVVEPTQQAEEDWAAEILKYDLWASPSITCTPGYFTNEGAASLEKWNPDEVLRLRRSAPYMRGALAYRKVLQGWRADGNLSGLILA